MITLKLEIDGKQKEFKQKSIKVRAMREMMKFQAKMEGKDDSRKSKTAKRATKAAKKSEKSK